MRLNRMPSRVARKPWLRFELTDPCLHLSHGFLAPLKTHGGLLFHPKFISQPGSINHGALSLLLRHTSLSNHLIQVMAHGGHLLLTLHLGSADGLVGASLVAQAFIRISELLLHHPAVTVGLLQESASLLQGVLVGIGPAVSRDKVVSGNSLGAALILKPLLNIADVALDKADVALALSICSVGMLQSYTKVNYVRVQFLLHAESLHLTLGLCLKSHLHALNGLAKVLPCRGKLILLLSNPPLNLLLDLSQLQGGAKHFVLLLLKGSFCFRESGLQLQLLSLQTLPDFVNLVDGAASLTDLVHNVLDLI